MRAPRFALAANVHDDTVTAGVQAKTQMARDYGVSAWRASATRMSLSQSLGSTIPTLLNQGHANRIGGKRTWARISDARGIEPLMANRGRSEPWAAHDTLGRED